LDALDECEDTAARATILNFLKGLRVEGVRFLATGRLDLPKQMNPGVTISIQAQNSDIETYVRTNLDTAQLEEEEEMSPNLQEEIIQGILSAAKGMY
jgi:hypothetical protein